MTTISSLWNYIMKFYAGVLLMDFDMLLHSLGWYFLPSLTITKFLSWYRRLSWKLKASLAFNLFLCYPLEQISVIYIRFDEFTIIPQAILLTVETYGFSHILPTLGLPCLVAYRYSSTKPKQTRQSLIQLFQVTFNLF